MIRSIQARRKPLAAAVLLGLFTACASAPAVPRSGPTPRGNVADTETGGIFQLGDDSKSVAVPINTSPEQVWAVVPRVYEKLGIPAEINEPAARRIGTMAFAQSRLGGKRTSEWVRCGDQGAGPSSGGMSRTRLSIVTTVRGTSDGGAELVTEVGGTSTRVEGTSTGAIACSSKGDLEQKIRDLVLEEIAR